MILLHERERHSQMVLLCAVRKIEEVRHGNKGVVERFDRGDPLVCVNG